MMVVESSEERHAKLKNNLSKIQKLVRKLPTMSRENIRKIEQKLELCRNQSKNPASDEWKKKMQVHYLDEGKRGSGALKKKIGAS